MLPELLRERERNNWTIYWNKILEWETIYCTLDKNIELFRVVWVVWIPV